MAILCALCETDKTTSWWKCCPTHTTERGLDVVCQNCANACFGSKETDGKTTTLMEEAIKELAQLPTSARVFITGAHTKWLRELEQRFKEEGLRDVVFYTPHQIMNGALRGKTGVLLIDDFWDLPTREAVYLRHEQERLKHKTGRITIEIDDSSRSRRR